MAMENSKGSSNVRNWMYYGKHAPLPPKSPFPCVAPSYADYVPQTVIGSKISLKPREGNITHQRTSSESFLIEEQPSWLDDLLNEPETPVRRGGHRRSSSDSFAYIDSVVSTVDYAAQDDLKYKNMMSVPWASQDFEYHREIQHAPFFTEANLTKHKNKARDSFLGAVNNPSSLHSGKDSIILQSPGQFSLSQDGDGVPCPLIEKEDPLDSGPHDPKASSERKDVSNTKREPSVLDSDNKRAKQQFAQRSRVRKLQYIAELERNVQALQAEGSGVSAELEFLNQQTFILGLENKALKQRLESIAQEQLIKYMEQEVLEREIGRLRALYQQQQQQQQQPQPYSSHRRTKSRDLDTQFANLSLKQKDGNSSRDPMTGPLHI